jgi:hypothetical protein
MAIMLEVVLFYRDLIPSKMIIFTILCGLIESRIHILSFNPLIVLLFLITGCLIRFAFMVGPLNNKMSKTVVAIKAIFPNVPLATKSIITILLCYHLAFGRILTALIPLFFYRSFRDEQTDIMVDADFRFPWLNGQNTVANVTTYSACLGITAGIALACFSMSDYQQASMFVILVSLFHFLEYFSTALYHSNVTLEGFSV